MDRLIDFCSSQLGFYNFVDYTGSYTLVKKTSQSIIEEVRIKDLKQDIKEYLRNIAKVESVWSQFASGNYINENFVDLLSKLHDANFNVSKKDEAYFFYQNGVIRLSPAGSGIISYSEFTGTVWKNQIIKRDFAVLKDRKSHSVFEHFLANITGGNNDRFISLESVIGYLLHPYKDPSFSKAVILLDENIDFSGVANGGTGKSLIAYALSQITPTVIKDGKRYNANENFVFDDIRPHHRILYFDDVKRNFQFEEFYSIITGSLKVNRKYKDSVLLPPHLTPKLLISSNNMVKGTGGNTDERRRIEFEIAPHYSADFSPKDEYGHVFFEDWDKSEWEQFDWYMLTTVNYFMKYGVKVAPSINLKENKLRSFTDSDFVDFADASVIKENEYDKADLLNDFRTLCPTHKNISGITFKRWLDTWAEYREHKLTHRKSNGKSILNVE